jgi:hypothetical protein
MKRTALATTIAISITGCGTVDTVDPEDQGSTRPSSQSAAVESTTAAAPTDASSVLEQWPRPGCHSPATW